MKREIIVNATYNEIKVAVLDNNVLKYFFLELIDNKSILNNIYKGTVKNILPALGAAFVHLGHNITAYLTINKMHNVNIGQNILVQICKEAIGSKCPKVTTNIAIPGKSLIYMPFANGIKISKKIDNSNRKRLIDLILELQNVLSMKGKIIVRTNAAQAKEQEIEYEFKYLFNLYQSIFKLFQKMQYPDILYEDFNTVVKVIRDYYSNNVSIIHIDSKKIFKTTLNYLKLFKSQCYEKVILYDNNIPILKAYNLEQTINNLSLKKVQLSSGGYLIIEELESISVIDVNSGKFTSKLVQEDTALQTNIEATKEIAKQIRLRNIGGIIIIDFIDMKNLMNRVKVFKMLRKYTKDDKAKIKIWPITHLGLIEMTRERKTKSLVSILNNICPTCKGIGII
ncbi:MAG: Rne/Rng family ribonuclease [Endomicrobium sp.]|nr:Rne/Rng family ribonuclease [Endomicrobium sp.]